MGIPIPDLLRRLRARELELGLSKRSWRRSLSVYMSLARFPRLYHLLIQAGLTGLSLAGPLRNRLLRAAAGDSWGRVRAFPALRRNSFQTLLARRGKQPRRGSHGS